MSELRVESTNGTGGSARSQTGAAVASADPPGTPPASGEAVAGAGGERAPLACSICDAPAPPRLFVKDGYPLHRCGRCEVVFSARPPAGDALTALYSAAYFTDGGYGYPDYLADEPAHRRQARKYLRVLARAGAPTGALLDVGCAMGFFLDEARRRGWSVRGCDLSAYAQQYAAGALGLDVDRVAFLDPAFAPPPASFDAATLFNVLEHLADPPAAAAKLARLVRPGGFVLLETWDPRSWFARALGSAWPTYAPPTVIHCFTPRTLGFVFPAPQWSLVRYRPVAKWISVRHGLALLEHEGRGTVMAGAVRALRGSWVGRLQVPYYLRDLTLALLRRTTADSPSAGRADEPGLGPMPVN